MTAENGEPEATGPRPEAGTEQAAQAEPAPVTGEPRVDEALAELARLAEVPDSEHVEAFEHIHQQLQAVLDEVGEREGPAPGPDRR